MRYQQAFGTRPETLPSTCSFQRGEHLFFGPECRMDKRAMAREWVKYALGKGNLDPAWIQHGTMEYFASHYVGGQGAQPDTGPFPAGRLL